MPNKPEQIREKTLILRVRLDDEMAFNELLGLYGPRIWKFTERMLQSTPHRIDDVNQEIWISIFRRIHLLRDLEKFKPWAFRIARDRVYEEYRKNKRTGETITLEEIVEEAEETSVPDFEEIRAGLDRLSETHKEVLWLRYMDDLSYEEIAQIVNASPGTVRSRIHYGKAALRKAIEQNL
ncbi:MAG: polymerase sigma factor, sigma-70 family [Verrucomicrobiales bacterium]|jgi:RNA polymerase sigma-70 factor (ECF subfamily)|nr:polymerase sigma factor, sigma-70 family [Verrucomicrobiales bacterium]MDB6131625.1 polymerase sigma factor, sigma-70 family [Verrucomicrobiales bacterium]